MLEGLKEIRYAKALRTVPGTWYNAESYLLLKCGLRGQIDQWFQSGGLGELDKQWGGGRVLRGRLAGTEAGEEGL